MQHSTLLKVSLGVGLAIGFAICIATVIIVWRRRRIIRSDTEESRGYGVSTLAPYRAQPSPPYRPRPCPPSGLDLSEMDDAEPVPILQPNEDNEEDAPREYMRVRHVLAEPTPDRWAVLVPSGRENHDINQLNSTYISPILRSPRLVSASPASPAYYEVGRNGGAETRMWTEALDEADDSILSTSSSFRSSRFVSPWEIEKEPNPVMFSHLNQGRKLERFYDDEFCTDGLGMAVPIPIALGQPSEQPQKSTVERNSAELEEVLVANADSALRAERAKKHKCPECSISFRTAGLKNKHINRKHIRRFACEICDANFHLNTDLQRHRKTVHKDSLDSSECKTWKCENEACERPDLVFTRKDNFERHLLRCQKGKS